jgi:hypothetical protein
VRARRPAACPPAWPASADIPRAQFSHGIFPHGLRLFGVHVDVLAHARVVLQRVRLPCLRRAAPLPGREGPTVGAHGSEGYVSWLDVAMQLLVVDFWTWTMHWLEHQARAACSCGPGPTADALERARSRCT